MKKTVLLALLCSLFFFGESMFAQMPGYVPTNGLQCWYGFSGNSNDASAAANHLTNNGATLATDRFNVPNAAYQFNGSSQYLIRNTPSFTFGQSSSFSVSWWMFRQTTGYGVAIMHGTPANGNFIWNFQTNTSSDIQFGTNKQGSAWAWAQAAYTPGQWVHVVATYNNGAMSLFLNGLSVASNTYTNTGAAQTNLPLYIGRGVSGAYFNGKIDDVGIWNRVLTQAEITALYNGCDVAITAQPAHVKATYGTQAIFTIATSNPSVAYQWQSSIGSGWQNVPNGGQYVGVFNDTLKVNNVTMLNNNQEFRCIVSQGMACRDTSVEVDLKVCGAITNQPVDTTVFINFGAQFSTGSNDPAALFMWQSDTGSGWWTVANGGQYTGASTNTLAVNLITMANNGQKFRCMITSGSCTDTTNEAELSVINNIGVVEVLATVISVYPNPAAEVLVIRAKNTAKNQGFVVINPLGQIVCKGDLAPGETMLNITSWQAGAYSVLVGSGQFIPFFIAR